MKIPSNLRSIYEAQLDVCQRLKERVDGMLLSEKKERWHYESRIKSPESFVIKVESGRCENPAAMEDFFACTIVVANHNEISDAEQIIRRLFNDIKRRPENSNITKKAAHSFQFDDVRLYVKLGSDSDLRARDYDEVKFEIQVKTFLQHAWAIATHDIIYKTDEVLWSRERIGYQIKAMLEHAELSIGSVISLSSQPMVNMSNTCADDISKVIELVKSEWDPARLPSNIKGLAENILNVLKLLRISIEDLREILDIEKQNQRGSCMLDETPYGAIICGLVSHRQKNLIDYLGDKRRASLIFVPKSIDIPHNVRDAKGFQGKLIIY